MALSKEEKAQLAELTRKANEPEGPPANVNFSLDLASDAAWDRAKKLGLVREPDDNAGGEEEEAEADDVPKRRSGYFGNQ